MLKHSGKGLYKKGLWDFGGTLDELNSSSEMPERNVRHSINWRISGDGRSREKRPGYKPYMAPYNFGGRPIRGIYDCRDSLNEVRVVVCTDVAIWISVPGGPWLQVYSQLAPVNHPIRIVSFNRNRPIVVGYDINLIVEPDMGAAYLLGIQPPAVATAPWVSGAGPLTGNYYYVYTYYRGGNFPCESNPSPEMTAPVAPSAQNVWVTLGISTDPKVTGRRIYRTLADGAIYFWLADIPNNTSTAFLDTSGDSALAFSDEVSWDRGVPTKGDFAEVWDNRLWLVASGMLWRTNTNTAEEMKSTNFIQVQTGDSDDIRGIRAHGDILYVQKGKASFKLEKYGDSLYELMPLAQKIGLEASGSLVDSDDLMFGYSKFGIEVYNGERFYRPILSAFVRRTLKSINEMAREAIVAGANTSKDGGEYWLAIPTGDSLTPNKVIVLDYGGTQSFYIYELYDSPTAFHGMRDGTLGNIFLIGTNDGGLFIYGEDTYSDNGHPIEAKFITAWISASGERVLENVLRRLFLKHITPQGRSLSFHIYRDFDKNPVYSGFLAGSTPTDGDEGREDIVTQVDCAVRALYLSFGFENNEDCGAPLRVVGFDGYFRNKIWKKYVAGD